MRNTTKHFTKKPLTRLDLFAIVAEVLSTHSVKINFCGVIGRKVVSVCGTSSLSGFKLRVKTGREEHDFKTRSYVEDKTKFSPLTLMFFCGLVGALFGEIMVTVWNISLHIIPTALILTTALLWAFYTAVIVFAILFFRKQKQATEWHGLEHKIIVLLEMEIVPTVENVMRMPKTLFHCGTILKILWWELLTLPWSGVYLIGKGIVIDPAFFIPTYLFALVSISGAQLLVFLRNRVDTRAKIFLHLFFAMPALVIPLLIEAFCATKEPTRDKIESVLDDIKALYTKLYPRGA